MKLIITGGRQSNSSLSYFNKEWSNGICGVVYEYDTKNNNLEEKVNYETPLKFRPKENFSISFKSGSIYENKLYITTLTEVLIYSLPKYILEERISLKIFNDLHHVIKHNNDLYIVVTGLDIVVRYSLSKKKFYLFIIVFLKLILGIDLIKKKIIEKLILQNLILVILIM